MMRFHCRAFICRNRSDAVGKAGNEKKANYNDADAQLPSFHNAQTKFARIEHTSTFRVMLPDTTWALTAEASVLGAIVTWMKVNSIAELSALLDIILALVGFGVTIYGVFKAKNAAIQAAEAANSAKKSIRTLETVVDFSGAIAGLEETKRLHREKAWPVLPDRYAAVRKLLVQLRNSQVELNDRQLTVIQNALANLSEIERQVERGMDVSETLKPARFNALLSKDIDALVSVLAEIQIQGTGG